MNIQKKFKALFFDLDGTLYFKGKALPYAQEVLKILRQQGITLKFLTNTDSLLPEQIAERAASYGIELEIKDIYTPPLAIYNYLRQNPHLSFYALASASYLKLFAALPNYTEQNPQIVVISDFRDSLSYASMNKAFQFMAQGAEIFATTRARSFYATNGELCLDTGAFVALFEYASQKRAQIFGKPEAAFFQNVLNTENLKPQETAMIGDELLTDIAGAQQCGITGILIKTGRFEPSMLEEPNIKPDFCINSLRDILTL